MCTFCDIASGTLEATIVLEDDTSLAFLDHRPIFPGHTLLVPREHIVTLGELPSDLLMSLFATTQRLALAVEAGMEAEGTFVAMNNKVSQSVPHFHVHVVPRRRKDGLRGFFWPRRKYKDDAEREAAGAAVRAALEEVPASQ
jgi:histidine triad (HIT) family protein